MVEKKFMVNGYRIRWNPMWKMFQCSMDGTIYAEFKKKKDAIEYCKNG